MNVIISVKSENKYLLIKASGIITNQEEHRLLTDRFYTEIKKHRSKNSIIDLSETSFPLSFEFLNDIVEYYSKKLPEEVKYWRIAIVDESSYRELGKYWEFIANRRGFMGYKVFSSMKEAKKFMDVYVPYKPSA